MGIELRPFGDPRVTAVFSTYPDQLRRCLLDIRELIFEAADETEGVGSLVETLKWKQPAYFPRIPNIGTTIRIDTLKNGRIGYAMYFICTTTLIANFRERYSELFEFEGNRALVFSAYSKVPRDAIKHCIVMALRYHAKPPYPMSGD